MKRLNFWLLWGLTLTLGLILGLLGFSIWEKTPTPVERVVWSKQAQWIAPQTPNYRFYARHTFNLPDRAKCGWLRISGDNDFTLYVNGKRIVRENSVLNNSLGLGAGLQIPFQAINDSNAYETETSVNYLLASSQDWKLTAYVDLTHHLRPGKNVIALEVQKGQTNPRMVVEGVVYSVADTNPINLTTGVTSWRVSNLSETHHSLQWFDPYFPDESWLEARVVGSVQEATYSRLSKNLFDQPLNGNWIAGTQSSKGQVWLRGIWQIPADQISRAYIRFAGQGAYSLLLNGTLVNNYRTEDGKQLHLLEVTKFLRPGNNILAVSLVSPLDTIITGSNLVNPVGVLDFLLDGWAETEKGEIVGRVATDNTWITLEQPVSGWEQGADAGEPVSLLSLPQTGEFQRSFEGNAYLLNYPNYLWHQSLWQLGGIIFAVVYASILGFWLRREDSWWHSLSVGAAILSPGTLFLIVITLLKHRYAESEVGLLFAQPQSNYLILIGFVGIVLLTLLFSQINISPKQFPRHGLWFLLGIVAFIGLGLAAGGNIFFILLVAGGIIALTIFWIQGHWQLEDIYGVLQSVWQSWGQWFLLLLIVSIGFGLRLYNLSFIDLDSDENTSLDASRGILRTGSPINTSGIWYTRGPFYQYLLALWLRILGDSSVNARLLSVLLGTATLILIYIFAHQVTGKVWIALLVTAVLAINPMELWYSRNIRFYQLLQFLTVLSFWSFLKGFIEQVGRRYQYIFFISLTLTLLTQEISLTLLPSFFIGFIYFYRPFRLAKDWQIVLCSLMTLTIFSYCLGFSAIRLLTPLAAIADSTASYLRLHFFNITELAANIFIGPDRMQTVYSFCFIIGFIYFLINRNYQLFFLLNSIVLQIIIVTILSYQLGERYIYNVYPLFVLFAIYSAITIAESLANTLQVILNEFLNIKKIILSITIFLLLSNLQTTRVLTGYHEAISRKNTQVFEYISAHKKPEDIVISPTPSFASVNLGGLDYFLMGTGFFDGVYWHEGRLIDRWAGGVVLTNIDQINNVLNTNKRVWIHVDDAKKGRFESDTWQYIETLGKPVIDTFATRLRLWQPEDGLSSQIPNKGKDLGAY
jgi:hypothetical protein